MLLSIKTILGTGTVLAIILAVVALILIRAIKNKKDGRSSCSHGCSGCAMQGLCHKTDNDKK